MRGVSCCYRSFIIYAAMQVTHFFNTETHVLPLGMTKQFTCRAMAVSVTWLDGTESAVHTNGIEVGEEESLGDGIVQRNLSVKATDETNNTRLECKALFLSNAPETILDIYILVQGIHAYSRYFVENELACIYDV